MGDLNFKYLSEGKGATVTARFGSDGITLCDPNRAGEGTAGVFQKIYEKALSAAPRPRRPGRTMSRRSLCNHAQAVL